MIRIPEHPRYSVSSSGVVYRGVKALRTYVRPDGLMGVRIMRDGVRTSYSVAHLVLRLFRGIDGEMVSVVFRDGDRSNCSADNLLVNRLGVRKGRYRGVSYCTTRGLYSAQVMMFSRRHHLGFFKTDIEAKMALDKFKGKI